MFLAKTDLHVWLKYDCIHYKFHIHRAIKNEVVYILKNEAV